MRNTYATNGMGDGGGSDLAKLAGTLVGTSGQPPAQPLLDPRIPNGTAACPNPATIPPVADGAFDRPSWCQVPPKPAPRQGAVRRAGTNGGHLGVKEAVPGGNPHRQAGLRVQVERL